MARRQSRRAEREEEKRWRARLPQEVIDLLDKREEAQVFLDNVDDRLDAAAVAAARKALGLPDEACLTYCMAWMCPGPIGICVYDEEEDPGEDNCLFCHDPRERK